MIVYRGMKYIQKIMVSGAMVFMLIIGFAHVSHAQVATTTLSLEDRASLIEQIKSEIQDLLVQLIAQLKIELSNQITSEVTTQVASSTAPVFGGVNITQVMANTSGVDIGKVSVVDGKGIIPLVIGNDSYVSGVARIKSSGDNNNTDYGLSWIREGTLPQFENLDAGDYTYSIKLYDRPYSQTDMGRSNSGVLANVGGTVTVPKQ